VSPAHVRPTSQDRRERRWPVLFVVAAVIAVVGVVAGTRSSPPPASALAVPSALVSPPDSESSEWYCVGQSTASGTAPGFLVFSNTTAHTVVADIATVSDAGTTVRSAVSVPARGVIAPSLPSLSSGSWLADTVTVAGGGVAVSQVVHGPSGWAEAPCQSSTSADWYFATGSTAASNTLNVALLNPTSTPVVVDLSFETPSGEVQPINYQGVVLNPGAVVVEDVQSEVQNAGQISAVVTARAGRIVAAELQTYIGPSSGLALVPGQTRAQSHWAIPQAEETSGGTSEIDIFNPGSVPEAATVHLRLASGPLAPLTSTVAPGQTWSIATSGQTRIPVGATYSAEIDATGGPGVVVARVVGAPSSATAPQAGSAAAVDGLSTTTATNQWLVQPPGTSGNLAVSGAAPHTLALLNVGGASETFSAYAVASGRQHLVASGTLGVGDGDVVSGSALSAAGLDPIVVRASGPMAVSEDLAPSGMVGVVTMPGLPLAAAIGL
jgi:Family of unknown function (DUF5719)